MLTLHSSAFLLFQDAAASASDVHLIMIAVWIIAIILLVVILGVIVGALYAVSAVKKIANDAQKKAQPLISKGQEIAGHVNEIVLDLKPKIAAVTADLQPKIASVTSDVQHISGVVRSKIDEAGQTFSNVNDTVQDVNGKTKAQVQRVNGMVSEALTTTEQVSRSIQHGIKVPVQKIAEWVGVAKVSIENLSSKVPFLHSTHSGKSAADARRQGSSSTAGNGPQAVPSSSPLK